MAKLTVLFVALLGTLLCFPGDSARAERIIDDFDTGPQFLFSVGAGSIQEVSASSALGGVRRSEATLDAGNSVSLQVSAGSTEVLDIANSGSSRGTHVVQYGYYDTTTVNGGSPSQLDSNWDFSGEAVFELDVTSIDSGSGGGSGGTLVVTVWDGIGAGNSDSTGSIPWPTTTGTWRVPFSSFTTTPNWGAIDRIRFTFTATNLSPDITLDIIRAVPEPSTVVLLLCGGALLGGTVRRRRRRK